MSCKSWFGVHICAYVFVTCSASGLDAGVGTGCKRRDWMQTSGIAGA
jgi:hypothetical protein